jgi:NAD-dependent SIR2 family protein deacetylase
MPIKKNLVYFLGAGSSYSFGYPLTWKIMPDILDKIRKGALFNSIPGTVRNDKDAESEKELLEYIELVYPGLLDIDIDKDGSRVPNITEVFSFVDHLCFYNTPHHPKMDETRLTAFRILLNRALAELLQFYEYELGNNKAKYADEIAVKNKFVKLIRDQYNENNITIITTNYDMVIDFAFIDEAGYNKIDYGIPYRDIFMSNIVNQPDTPLLKYYKLHGSLNWLMCSLCGRYYINPYGSIVHQEFREEIDDNNICVCNKEMRLKSVLVAPSIVRDIRDSNLLQIWKAALESIRTADKLIMIGYSLPAEDLAIKSIILRGLNGRTGYKMPELEVVQFGLNAKPNYQNIFGKTLGEENYYDKGLAAYLDTKTC